MSQVYWVFYDTVIKVQSNPIATEAAQTSIMKMRPEDVARFLIWTPGWQNWQPLKAYLESDQKNFVSTFTTSKKAHMKEAADKAAKEVIEHTQTSFKKEKTKTFSNIKLDEETISRIVRQESGNDERFDGDDLTMSGIKKPKLDFSNIGQKAMDKRETRHELKIEILIMNAKGKYFRSRSKNISLSGALLQDTVPFDYYEYPFDAIVVNNHSPDPHCSRVKLKAKTVGDGITQRIQFLDVTPQQKANLQTLLEFYLKQQETLKKQAG